MNDTIGTTVRSRAFRSTAVLAGTAATAFGILAAGAGSASAATTHNWDGVAQCESSGDWSIDTGNGYYGGLQFSPSTWDAYGGGQYASQANLATKDQQIAIAENVLVGQGVGAWPVCGQYLTDGTSTSTAPAAPAPSTGTTVSDQNVPAPAPAAPAAPAPAPAPSTTVYDQSVTAGH